MLLRSRFSAEGDDPPRHVGVVCFDLHALKAGPYFTVSPRCSIYTENDGLELRLLPTEQGSSEYSNSGL